MNFDSPLNEDYTKKYEIDKKCLIGTGNYTEVYKAKNIIDKKPRAIKIIKLNHYKLDIEHYSESKEEAESIFKDFIKRLRNEIKTMKICGENNENSVKYYESFQTEDEFAIVMELCNQSLLEYKKGKKFNSDQIYEIIAQLNNTFKLMKANKDSIKVHRDLKPENILISNKGDKKIFKLCDYGISKSISEKTKLKTAGRGTPNYMAPEIMELSENNDKNQTKIYDDKCDLWSLGIIIYELFFGYRPFNGINEIKNYGNKLLKKTGDEKLDDLIFKLLEHDPNNRIGWEEYFIHPFVNKNEITIIYKINNSKEIKIFGEEFVKNNKGKCKIIYKGKDYELEEYFKIKNNEDILEIKLSGINNVTDMNYMFHDCKFLESLSNISKWKTDNVISMSYLFNGCVSLKNLPDISKWNTNNVTNMSYLFCGCESIKNLPNISKWNTNKVTNMSYLFNGCESLKSLPDISKWNTEKVFNMSDMFHDCKSLKTIPNISKWNINNVTNISYIFAGCKSLKTLPDIGRWNTNNVTNMNDMFFDCESLEYLPDISKLNTENVDNMKYMFDWCKSLKYLPDISKWNTKKVRDMSYLFDDCKSLTFLPDISKWNTDNIINMSCMFRYCESLKSLPDISKWKTNNVINMDNMFSFCESLVSLPDISKWNTDNVRRMRGMFKGCNFPLNNLVELIN